MDESGNPLAGMPVTIGTATATTDAQGDFTLTGIGANPSPLSAGGSVATADGRLALSAPVAQLLGHTPYADANNVIATPLIVPKVDWSGSVEGHCALGRDAAANGHQPGDSRLRD